MSFQHILFEQQAGVATITFNQPETRNAMTPEMGNELGRAIERIRADSSVRVVVVTGSGKSFCAGGNLHMIARDTGGHEGSPTIGASPRDFYDRFLAIRQVPVPTIAALNGHAIGAGFCFALACDLRIAAEDAKMGMTFARLGIHPGMGATYFLPRLIGSARACELFFTGRVIDAREAERLGIVNHAVPREELPATVNRLAQEIAAGAPIAVRLTKKAIYRGLRTDLDDVLDYESLQQAMTFTTDDAREGVSAVLEKRTPHFSGR